MKFGISREVLPPISRIYRIGLLYVLAVVGMALAAAAVHSAAPKAHRVTIDVHTPEPTTSIPESVIEVVPMPLPAVIEVTAPAAAKTEPAVAPGALASGDGFHFVMEVDGSSYMRLGDGAKIERGPARVIGEYKQTAIASVTLDDVPDLYRQWHGREVIVEGTCRATVDGFAIVARLTGSPDYYGSDTDEWNEKSLFEAGEVSLVAALDGCAGSYARDARLPGILAAVDSKNPEAVAAARSDFIASDAAKAAQADWRSAGGEGNVVEVAGLEARSIVHPTTRARFVSLHLAADEGCGGPDVNLFVLYRVDDKNEVTRVHLERLSDTSRIEKLVDVDGDGRFERIVADWLGASYRLESLDSKVLESLDVPFYGCPC